MHDIVFVKKRVEEPVRRQCLSFPTFLYPFLKKPQIAEERFVALPLVTVFLFEIYHTILQSSRTWYKLQPTETADTVRDTA
jgi:hypothetical protein